MQRQEFMRISPRYFAELVRQYRDRCQRADGMLEVMLAQLTAMVANTGFKGWEEPRKPEEFMPSEWRKRPLRKRRPRQVIADELRRIFDPYVK